MDEMKVGYKLVSFKGNKKWSFNLKVFDTIEKGCVEYIVGKPAIPKADCGPLALFDTVENARNFLASFNNRWIYDTGRIYQCQYKPSSETTLWYGDLVCEAFLPLGTILADEIILGKAVRKRIKE